MSDVDLADLLTRQLDADEAAAQASLGEPFTDEDGERKDPAKVWPPPALKRYTQPSSERYPWPEWVSARVPFIETWSPARVLAEVASKREILRQIGRLNEISLDANVWTMDEPLAAMLKALAAPYAGRDGWNEAWVLD